MAIETKIDGDLDSIQASVDWLRGTFGSAVADSAADAARAGADSAHDWLGVAGDAFRAQAGRLKGDADLIGDGVAIAADGFDRYADALRAANRRMGDIRDAAAAAGLELVGTQIMPPGAEPAVPGAKDVGKAAAGLLADYHRKVKAFEIAAMEVAEVAKSVEAATRELVKAGAKVNDALELIDWSKIEQSKAVDALRKGGKLFKWADFALTGFDIAKMRLEGKPPGRILARTAGEEVAGYLELGIHPAAALYVQEKYGINLYEIDLEEPGADYAERLYGKISPDYRTAIDILLLGPNEPSVAVREAAGEMLEEEARERALDIVDVIGRGSDMYDTAQDLAEDARDHIFDGLEPVPSWP